jgi:hypothetical protein
MADTKFSTLPVKSTTVDLTADIFAVVSGGVTEQVPANLIPFTKILTANTSIYIATTGNDSTGDGSVGLPYLTPHKAYEHLQDYFLGAGVIATIQCAAGTYTIASTLIPYHPQGSQVLLKGATMLGTVVDGDFVASAATTTTNLETRYATIFRGNFADHLVDSGAYGGGLLFKCEDILFDGDSMGIYGIYGAAKEQFEFSGSVGVINCIDVGIYLSRGSSLNSFGSLSSTHNLSGIFNVYGCDVKIDNGIIAYNTNTGILTSNDSATYLDGIIKVRNNLGDGIIAAQKGFVSINTTVNSTANGLTDYYVADVSYMNIATGALISGDSVTADRASRIRSAATAGVTFSPAHGVNGNTDSLIYA